MSTLCPGEPCNSPTNLSDASSNMPSSSSISSCQPSDSAPETEDNQITKYHGQLLTGVSSRLHENVKEKVDERKGRSSLQCPRLCNIQVN